MTDKIVANKLPIPLTQREKLNEVLECAHISEGRKDFARDLLTGQYGLNRRGKLSPKQSEWVEKLYAMTKEPPKPQPATQLTTGMAKVYAFFANAREHLKSPKLVMGLPGGKHLRIYLSGSRSKAPNVLNLVTEDEYGSMNYWLGRVHPDGKWEHREGDDDLRGKASKLLERLAEDPAKVAKESARITGNCCFCHRPLTDDRSTEVGYGPVCADHWSLPWG